MTSFNLDKTPEAGGVLQGIKGQYLIFDGGVINLRKYSGYRVEVRAGETGHSKSLIGPLEPCGGAVRGLARQRPRWRPGRRA